MSSSTTHLTQEHTGPVAKALVVVVIAVLFASLIAFFLLPRPYDAIGIVVIYLGLLACIVAKLSTCIRLSHGSPYLLKLNGVSFWMVIGVLALLPYARDIFTTGVRDYLRLGTGLCFLLALLYSLELVETLLVRTSRSSDTASNTTEAPHQPVQ
jgi:hypothetical protein